MEIRKLAGAAYQEMDTSNWRPTQGGSAGGGDSSLESGDWRSQLQADLRQRIVNKMYELVREQMKYLLCSETRLVEHRAL
ncbi:hypothetical protein OSB04_030004 [Centaurea solstitialis]|uniref:Uncharacterized protein n=1 Tax=Centaurea solstitialis TaxID=347529 RepID=A0AA38SJS9_9ASTR|nr:hypothetical protein OSB04_030004 [Centaurea solstitialis]